MGWTVNNFTLGVSLESILECIGDIRDTNGEVVGGSNGNIQTECRFCKDWRGILVKFNAFHLRSTISTTARII